MGATHVGRGGAANIATRDPEEVEAEAAAKARAKANDLDEEEHKKSHHHQGLAEKAKGFFKKA